MKQRDPEWFAARCGRVTASRFGDVLATIKSGEAASRRNYKAQIVCERLTGVPQETYQNEAMRFGTEWEPFARIAYEAKTGNIVQEVAFITHKTELVGASPDGFVGEHGGLEIKVPNTATHIDTLLKGMEPEHIAQVQGNMWLSSRRWWDFVSYDPRMPEAYQLYIHRVERDDKYIAMLAEAVGKFISEVNELIRRLEEWASKDK